MIKPALDVRPSQRQRFTPYLQRSIQVLRASLQALQKEIASALASNLFVKEDNPIARSGTRPNPSESKHSEIGPTHIKTDPTKVRDRRVFRTPYRISRRGGKNMLTPNSTRDFRSFFARQIDVNSGPGYSASMVQLGMRKMIEFEPREKPPSTRTISQTLRGKGSRVPRRTVTKYRNHMHSLRLPRDGEKRPNTTH